MLVEEDILWALTADYVILTGCFFLPWDWLHFFLSIDFLNCMVLAIVFPMFTVLITLFVWFYLLHINSFDFNDCSFTFMDDYLIRLITSYWFWQKVFWRSFSNYMIFLSLYFSSFWKFLFIRVTFYNFLWSSVTLFSFYRNFSS